MALKSNTRADRCLKKKKGHHSSVQMNIHLTGCPGMAQCRTDDLKRTRSNCINPFIYSMKWICHVNASQNEF